MVEGPLPKEIFYKDRYDVDLNSHHRGLLCRALITTVLELPG